MSMQYITQWIFKIGKSLDLPTKEEGKTQIKWENKEDVALDITKTQWITRDCYKLLTSIKWKT